MFKIGAISKTLLHEETLIGMVLADFHVVKEAQKLEKLASKALHEHPIVSFGRKVEGHIAYGHEITEATLGHARIRVSPKDAVPEYRYFKRIHAVDGAKVKIGEGHGLSASTWGRTDDQGNFLREDGKYILRFCYPGYPPHPSAAQTWSMLSSLHAEFPQACEVGPFLDKAMAAAKEMGLHDVGVINTSWSMGAANALSSNLYFKHRGIPTVAILGDPWRASAAVQNIATRSSILRPLFNNNHADVLRYAKPELRRMLAEDVVSVYPAVKDGAGGWTRTSRTAHMPFLEALGVSPVGVPVGKVFHIDAKNLEVIEQLAFLGNTHYRPNIINHLATHGNSIVHEIPQVAAGQGTARATVAI